LNQYIDLLRREKDFRRVFASELVSLGGDWFAVVPLLALLPRLTGSGMWGGLVLAADTAVFALLSPYAGRSSTGSTGARSWSSPTWSAPC
jgi:hypothetical protein